MKSKVYFIESKDEGKIPEKLHRLLSASELLTRIAKDTFVAIKTHFGEKGNTGHIRPEWLKVVIDEIKGMGSKVFLTDTNTLYRQQRFNSVDHLITSHEHGFGIDNVGCPVIIADGIFGRNFREVLINQKHFKTVKIAPDFLDIDFLICASHVTGHCQTGFAGAIKNLGMGCASRAGKLEQHTSVLPTINPEKCTACKLCIKWCPEAAIILKDNKATIIPEKCIGCGECTVICRDSAIKISWNESAKNLQEKMVEYTYGVAKALENKMAYLNFLTHIKKDCDCMGHDDPKVAPDIGILASMDPVAIDKASIDLVNRVASKDIFLAGYPEVDYTIQIKYAENIGMGSSDYELIKL